MPQTHILEAKTHKTYIGKAIYTISGIKPYIYANTLSERKAEFIYAFTLSEAEVLTPLGP